MGLKQLTDTIDVSANLRVLLIMWKTERKKVTIIVDVVCV